MDRELLTHFPVVVAVARRGGFAAAAAALNMSPSAVSHAVKTVEGRLGQPLFARTTRSVALTEAGATFIAAIGPALTMLDESVERLQAARGEISGVLRINAPRLALPLAITPAIVAMSQLHPNVTIEVTCDERLVDIVAAGYDAGVRLGGMIAQDMVAVRLTKPFKAIMVAAPAYLAARGTPRSIADLADHNCIGYRLLASGAAYAWDLHDGGHDVSVTVNGTVRVSDAVVARDLVREGLGIAYLFEPLVRDELRRGTLKQVLPAASIEEPGLFIYFPRYATQAPKLRAFVDIARESMRQRPAATARSRSQSRGSPGRRTSR